MAAGLSAAKKDTLILGRIFEYQQAHNADIKGIEDNVYAKFRFNVERRNATLWLIPTMDVLCKDPREYIRESYNKVIFNDPHDFDIRSQVLSGTIRKNRKALPTLIDFATPNIYDIALYEGHMLSPFNKVNRRYYHYTQKQQNDSTTRLDFRPKHYNTQLLNGYAIIETAQRLRHHRDEYRAHHPHPAQRRVRHALLPHGDHAGRDGRALPHACQMHHSGHLPIHGKPHFRHVRCRL